MSVFISYSRKDADFVDKLSYALIENNVKVWKDDMKMVAGDLLSTESVPALKAPVIS